MSATTTPTGKGGKAAVVDKYDADSMIPLLLATLGNPPPNYKTMAALDPQGRTESAFQHRFRSWRKEGLALVEANPEVAAAAATTPGKKRAPIAKKNGNGKGNAKQADVGEEEEAADEGTGAAGIKKEDDIDMVSQPGTGMLRMLIICSPTMR